MLVSIRVQLLHTFILLVKTNDQMMRMWEMLTSDIE